LIEVLGTSLLLLSGKVHGYGTMTGRHGTKYVGLWKDGKRDGHVTQTWSDGSKYLGEWKDGNWTGQGKETPPSYFPPDSYNYKGEPPEGPKYFFWIMSLAWILIIMWVFFD